MFENFEAWRLFKCGRFSGFQTDWDGNGVFDKVDAQGIAEYIGMIPAKGLLLILDLLSPVGKALGITCSSGHGTEWAVASGLLWLLLIGVIAQTFVMGRR